MKKKRLRIPQFHNVIDIPEGTSGAFEIKHDHRKAGAKMPLASARTVIMGGDESGTVQYTYPTRWHELLENGKQWMSDWPIEQWQMLNSVKPITSGRVIIGGLGLGVIATWIAKRPRVSHVTVVELSQDVINLVRPHLLLDDDETRQKLHIVHADLLEYIRSLPPKTFDWAFYDIWTHDGEATFFEVVCPLLEASHLRVNNPPLNWNENVMRGQLYHSIQGRYTFATKKDFFPGSNFPSLEELATPSGSIWKDWAVPFFQWIIKHNPSQDEVEKSFGLYASGYGRPGFMSLWNTLKRTQ